jgi:hypothetical protein
MTLNLRAAKVGDSVKFRNGGTSVVTSLSTSGVIGLDAWDMAYSSNGTLDCKNASPFDIVEIISAPKAETVKDVVSDCLYEGMQHWYQRFATAIIAEAVKKARAG